MNRAILFLFLNLLVAGAEGATLRGIVLDADERPVVGARIDIATAAPREGPALFCPSCYLDCSRSTNTDSHGRFELSDLSDALKFRVLFTATGRKSQLTKLVDPRTGELTIRMEPLPANIDLAHNVRGQVTSDADKPIAGALVWPVGGKTASRRWHGLVQHVDPVVCDHDGRFIMMLPADMQAVDLQVTADGTAGATVPELAPGGTEHRIPVPTGARVVGQVQHEGRPVSGCKLAVVQEDRGSDNHFIKSVGTMTDEKGRFEFNYLPPDQPYVIYTVVGEGSNEQREIVLSTKRFTVKASGSTRDLGTLQLEPSVALRGRVELPEGKQLPADARLMLDRDPAWDLIAVPIAADGTFSVTGLPPETYEVKIRAEDFEVDHSRLGLHSLSPQSFGIHLKNSPDELKIPLLQK